MMILEKISRFQAVRLRKRSLQSSTTNLLEISGIRRHRRWPRTTGSLLSEEGSILNYSPCRIDVASLSTAPSVSSISPMTVRFHDSTAAALNARLSPRRSNFVPPPKEIVSLFETLLHSQQLIPPPTRIELHDQHQHRSADMNWIPFFADLGSARVMAAAAAAPEETNQITAQPDGTLPVESVVPVTSPVTRPRDMEQKDAAAVNETETELPRRNPVEIHVTKPIVDDTASSTVVGTEDQEKLVQSRKMSIEENVRRSKQQQQDRLNQLQTLIGKSIDQRKPMQAMKPFYKALHENLAHQLPAGLIRALFFKFKTDPFEAYEIMRFYQHLTKPEHGADPDFYADLYRHQCELLVYLDPVKHERQQILALVHDFVKEVQKLNRHGQEMCLPVLVSSLVQQKMVGLGNLARVIFQYMCDQDLPMQPGYWEHLLSLSKYYRQEDLPYADILQKAVQAGRRPHPVLVANAMQNLYPYHNTGATFRMLQAIVDLQSTLPPGDIPYRLDIAMLEAISSAAAAKGFFDMNLLVWDMLDFFNYQPTEGIYENTIIAFCARPPTYANAFCVLADMEEKGIRPSRALIRGMSVYLRESPRNLEIALQTVRELRLKGRVTTVAALNSVLSGAGERGDVDRAMAILEEFDRNNLEPDADSYSYALEALGRNLGRRTLTPATNEIIDSFLRLADTLLDRMEDSGVVPTHHLVRDYVELLCHAQEVETATTVVLEFLSRGLVNNKTLYRVAMANVELKRLDVVERLAAYFSEPVPMLLSAIQTMKQQQTT